ncbi:hypothetical protein BJP36_42200 [Moorena producens JHB]|uniref:Uncharacterized protein n=1 Tax=Moorena producens (strain JHB) TaxID=1454205 RepID=A0A9Q9UVL9_MOOP1|nr:hypothetical protein [Moorena producens]WAN68975.1 hypothetical protein BJP36_42200 [Moorena producens JHB]
MFDIDVVVNFCLLPFDSCLGRSAISVPGAAVELMAVFPDAIATHSGKLRGGLSYDLEQ